MSTPPPVVMTERDIAALEWAVKRARTFTPTMDVPARRNVVHAEEAVVKLQRLLGTHHDKRD